MYVASRIDLFTWLFVFQFFRSLSQDARTDFDANTSKDTVLHTTHNDVPFWDNKTEI